jgi:RNA polymerase sigma-70 factor (ECF subfamily)
LPDTAALPEELAEQHEEQRRILRAFLSLPPKPRLVVWLRYTRQWSYAEIGQRLNIPETTAKTYFSRAKPLLRQLLAREDQD